MKSSKKNTDNYNSKHTLHDTASSVKIPSYAWKVTCYIKLHCYYGNVCRNNVDTGYS